MESGQIFCILVYFTRQHSSSNVLQNVKNSFYKFNRDLLRNYRNHTNKEFRVLTKLNGRLYLPSRNFQTSRERDLKRHSMQYLQCIIAHAPVVTKC